MTITGPAFTSLPPERFPSLEIWVTFSYVRVRLADWLFEGIDDDELQTFGALSEKLISRMGGRALSRLPEQ